MNPTLDIPSIPHELAAEFEEIVADLAAGIRRPDKMRAACERMDRIREENRRLFGVQDIAVQLIRQARDEP